MIRQMALALVGVLWASTAQAQVECGQCQPQATQCQQQAHNAQQSCLAPYNQTLNHCRSEAEVYRSSCWQVCLPYGSGGVYCYQCDWQADSMIQQCQIQYNGEAYYCQSGYDASMQMCQENYDACMGNCSNNVAYLSPVSGGRASLWNAVAASGACVDVSISERAPAIAKPMAEL